MVLNGDEVFIQHGAEDKLHGIMLSFTRNGVTSLMHRGNQYEVGVAERMGKFCPSDSARPTDRQNALNVFTCRAINHFRQKAASNRNLEELSERCIDTKSVQKSAS